MRIIVETQELTKLFNDFIKSGKLMFNFKTDGDKLSVQLLSDFVMTREIGCRYLDGPKKEFEMSAYVNSFCHVLNDEEQLILEFTDGLIRLTQGTFVYTLLKEHEARKELIEVDETQFKPLKAQRLKYLVSLASKLEPISRELKIMPVDPVIMESTFAVHYSNVALMETIDIDDMCIPYNVLKQVAPLLSAKSEYICMPEKELVIIKSGTSLFYLSTANYNLKAGSIPALKAKLSDMHKVGSFCITSLSAKLATCTSVMNKQSFSLSIKGKDLEFGIQSNDRSAAIKIGTPIDRPDFTIALTAAKANVINNLFKEKESFDIYRAPNCIAFADDKFILLISGIVY